MKTVSRHFSFLFFCFLIFALILCLQSMNAQPSNKKVNTTYDDQQIAIVRDKPMNGFFGLSFTNMVPQNEYFDNLPKPGLGLSIYGGYYADPVPIAFGAQIDFLFNGSSEKDFASADFGNLLGWHASSAKNA